MDEQQNKTLLVRRPSSDRVLMLAAVVLDPSDLNIEKLLAGLVPEMAKGGVKGGLLVVGDSTLVLRNMGDEVLVDEVATAELLALADIHEPWTRETLLASIQRWLEVMKEHWRDRLVGQLRDLLVPHLVAGLVGDVEIYDGIWGEAAHRLSSPR